MNHSENVFDNVKSLFRHAESLVIDPTSRTVPNVAQRSMKGRRSQAAGKHETYERLAEESMESLEREIEL